MAVTIAQLATIRARLCRDISRRLQVWAEWHDGAYHLTDRGRTVIVSGNREAWDAAKQLADTAPPADPELERQARQREADAARRRLVIGD